MVRPNFQAFDRSQPAMTASRPQPQPGILEIAPYVPGRSSAEGVANPTKLSANESPLGASPAAITAYKAMADKLEIYPEGSSRELRNALAEVHGLDAERIVVGAGSDEILHLIAQAYIGVGDEAVISQYGFMVYPIVTRAAGGIPVIAPETEYCADIDALLAAVTDKTRVVYLANPNNPTGTYLPAEDLERLHQGLPQDVLLVIDSAYAEYVTAEDYEPGIALASRAENVVMVRTFSKMGLAALRIGWLYGPAHVVEALNRIRGPFNLSVPAQAAAAAAARDTAFTEKLCAHNAQWRDWLTKELSGNAMQVLPSQGNFILVLFPDTPGQSARDANAALLASGLIVREMGGYGLANALRISIGSAQAMQAVANCLRDFFAK